MLTYLLSDIYIVTNFNSQEKRLHGYSCNRNRFFSVKANPTDAKIMKFVYTAIFLTLPCQKLVSKRSFSRKQALRFS